MSSDDTKEKEISAINPIINNFMLLNLVKTNILLNHLFWNIF